MYYADQEWDINQVLKGENVIVSERELNSASA
jgi:hypothetical protein